MARIGVFVCHCGENIARTVDCAAVAAALRGHPGVAHSVDYKYMCSDPGQNLVKEAIREHRLDGVVVASCSPHMHEKTFRRAVAGAGLNPFQFEMANIREHCAWIHERTPATTEKATDLTRVAVEKVKRNSPLTPIRIPVTHTALIIGGGIAGIQAALDIAEGGRDVIIVEKEPSIGGHMSQLSETFPTLDCSQCILTPRMVDCYQHPRIKLHTWSEVEKLDGYIGNFTVTIRKKNRSVDLDACTGCGACMQVCPAKKALDEFDMGLRKRTAIYTPFPQAVPNKPVIDQSQCLSYQAEARAKAKGVPLKKPVCQKCAAACAAGAIHFDRQDELVTEQVGAVVVATGFQLYSVGKEQPDAGLEGYGEYDYGEDPDIIDGLQFERLASASGPTGGKILRPSDGQPPQTVVFVQCTGSRDPAKGIEYCSGICCMYTAKHAMLYQHSVHGGRAVVFYMDIRATGKGYEAFTRRAAEEAGAEYLRGRVSRMYRVGQKIRVHGADTLSGEAVVIDADLVVLATAVRPQPGVKELAQKLSISYDQHGFLNEAHPKLRPVESNTAGIFLAGCAQAPRDIPDSVAMASATAAKVLALFSKSELEREPVVARVNAQSCSGCFHCERACPYGAITQLEVKDRQGRLLRVIAEVNPGLCQGCGTCTAICPSHSVELDGFTGAQIFAAIQALSL
ncbi:MAG: CoB--CoM heterodisulfide reductase iron-sulfur subunit A family protein [Pseudomonadota bacterium]